MDTDSLFGDSTTTLLIAGLALAILAYYFWPEAKTCAESEVTVDEATRKQAKPLIAVASDASGEELFTLSPMPLAIRAGEALKAKLQTGEEPDPDQLREALWVQQRSIITRLESELDYAQQADISEHFAIAAPANQPGVLLAKALKDLEAKYGQLSRLLTGEENYRFWHGRAMILMVSTRKLFDHVAWLTSAGLAHSASGSFMLAGDEVVMISIYATRLELLVPDEATDLSKRADILPFGSEMEENLKKVSRKSIFEAGFGRPLLRQVCRAAVRCVGGERTPMWVEYGLAHWLTDQMVGKATLREGEKAPKWEEQSRAIFDPEAWTKAAEDSTRLEQLVIWSGLYVDSLKAKEPKAFVSELRELRAASVQQAAGLLKGLEGKPVASN